MRKGQDLIGKPIVTLTTGERVGSVQDLVFDPDTHRIRALLVDEGGLFRAARVVPFLAVSSFGEDAVIVEDPASVVSAGDVERVGDILNDKKAVIGTTLMTTDGKNLGRLADLYFNEQTGDVVGYDVTGGLFADLSSGRSFVPAPTSLTLGHDVALVPPETAFAMEEQEPGGLKGALATAGTNLHEATSSIVENAKQAAGNVADATRDRQKTFVVGKTVSRDVTAQDGTVIISQGSTITQADAEHAERLGALGSLFAAAGGSVLSERVEHLNERVDGATDRAREGINDLRTHVQERMNATPPLTADEARMELTGQVVTHDVIAPDGTVVITANDTIMPEMIEMAERHGALPELMAAATPGVSTGPMIGTSTTAATAAPMDPIGRRAEQEVIARDGTLIAARGAMITASDVTRAEAHGATEELNAACGLQAAPASSLTTTPAEPRLLGRRVVQDVYGPHGTLLAAQGQIVTLDVLTRARDAGMEARLAQAVPGSHNTTGNASETLATGVQSVRDGASNLLDRARDWLNETRERTETVVEERRMNAALGRPVTRVILDRSDRVILNVGEIVTHRAIAQARESGVLELLLDSVSMQAPNVTAADARPPVTGEAALPNAGTPDLGDAAGSRPDPYRDERRS